MYKELFVSTDIEADGPVPGLSNMLSFGSAVYDTEKNIIGTFSRNLEVLPNAKPHPLTMSEFWFKNERNKKAYLETRKNQSNIIQAMQEYKDFIEKLPGKPIFVGYPAVYDFKWIDWYFHYAIDHNPFGFSGAIDIKSFAWAYLGGTFKSCVKKNMPKEWFDNMPHTHIALDDAIEQGALFVNIWRQVNNLPAI